LFRCLFWGPWLWFLGYINLNRYIILLILLQHLSPGHPVFVLNFGFNVLKVLWFFLATWTVIERSLNRFLSATLGCHCLLSLALLDLLSLGWVSNSDILAISIFLTPLLFLIVVVPCGVANITHMQVYDFTTFAWVTVSLQVGGPVFLRLQDISVKSHRCFLCLQQCIFEWNCGTSLYGVLEHVPWCGHIAFDACSRHLECILWRTSPISFIFSSGNKWVITPPWRVDLRIQTARPIRIQLQVRLGLTILN